IAKSSTLPHDSAPRVTSPAADEGESKEKANDQEAEEGILYGYDQKQLRVKDLLRQLDREDLNQLWALVKEYLSIRLASNDKEMKLWVELKRMYEPNPEDQLWTLTQNYMHAPVKWKLYDLSGVHHVTAKDKEIFMLVEMDYPLRRGNKMHKAFPLPGESSHWQYKFPLPVEGVLTARRMEIPFPGVCTAMMKKLPVKENRQLH
nr:hypothetical protein [Tanacetum cinerariifolium]